MITTCENQQTGCHLDEKALTELYVHLFNAINPQVYYSHSTKNMIEDAFNITQNNLKSLLAIIQDSLPKNHPLQDEMKMLLNIAEQKTSTLPPIKRQPNFTH